MNVLTYYAVIMNVHKVQYVAVPSRNRTFFSLHISIALLHLEVLQHGTSIKGGAHTYVLGKLMNTYHIYTAHMSPTLNGSFALECFERGNAIKIRNGMMFNFYPGLPHMHNYMQYWILDLVKESLLAEKRFAGKPVLMNSKQVARNRRRWYMSPSFLLLCRYTTTRFSIANNKIEHHSIAYFNRITAFEAPEHRSSIKGRAHMCWVNSWILTTLTQHIWASLLTEVLR